MKVPPNFSSTICAVTQVVAYEMSREDFYNRVVVPFHKMGLTKQAVKSVKARKAFHRERLQNELTKRNTDTTGMYGTLNGEAAKTPALPETNNDDGGREEFSKTFKAVIKLHNHLIDNENNVHEREWSHTHKHLRPPKHDREDATSDGHNAAPDASKRASATAAGGEGGAGNDGDGSQGVGGGGSAWPRQELSEEQREAMNEKKIMKQAYAQVSSSV